VLRLYRDFGRIRRGDKEVIARYRPIVLAEIERVRGTPAAKPGGPDEWRLLFCGYGNTDVLLHVLGELVEGLNPVVLGLRFEVYVNDFTGPLRLGTQKDVAIDRLCVGVINHMTADIPIPICLGCGNAFKSTDPRKEFCSRACGNRIRQRRWKERHQHVGKEPQR
jgi:hypothetical protein